jgi:cysteine desulfurase / selenocysteine lyase
MKIVGPPDPDDRYGVASFRFEGIHPHDLASLLDSKGICVRAGHHCAQPLMERLGVPALTRASPYLYNTDREIELLFDGIEEAARWFKIPLAPRATAG